MACWSRPPAGVISENNDVATGRRRRRTLHNLRWFEVTSVRGEIENGALVPSWVHPGESTPVAVMVLVTLPMVLGVFAPSRLLNRVGECRVGGRLVGQELPPACV